MKFQFNKTELQRIRKDLKIRYAALPTLKNKESALRAEIKKHKQILREIEESFVKEMDASGKIIKLFSEFQDLVELEKVEVGTQKLAGVKIPLFKSASFVVKDVSLFNQPVWFYDGVEIVKRLSEIKIKVKVEKKRIEILEYARKKTTQKVNLYEKVQIPTFEEAIIKIKRFLEDEENLDRASQKIVKKRKAAVI